MLKNITLNRVILLKEYSFNVLRGLTLRRVLFLFSLLFVLSNVLTSCNSENAPDCLQSEGKLIRQEVGLPSFDKITVFEKVALVLKEGPLQKVEIETGEFLLNEISAEVEGNRLILRNENGCNLFRKYGITTIYVTAPNISEIRSSTGLLIRSDGALAYPNLSLISESFNNPESETTDGSFDLDLATETVSIVVNGIAYFKLSGTATTLNVTIAAGDSRIEAEELLADNVIVNHRGTNDILTNPQLAVRGIIRGNGNVICFNRPETVEVDEIFNGRLLFN
jgi:hypothetical protein